MSISLRSCYGCSKSFSAKSNICPACGLLTSKNGIFNFVNLETQIENELVIKYRELKDQLDKFDEFDSNLKKLNDEKNKCMTRINAIEREIEEYNMEIKQLREKQAKYDIPSLTNSIRDLTGMTGKKKNSLDVEIEEKFTSINNLRTEKSRKQQEFFNYLDQIEQFQADNHKRMKVVHNLETVSDEIAGIIYNNTEHQIQREITTINQYIVNLESDLNKLEKALSYFENSMEEYRRVKKSLVMREELPNELKSLAKDMAIKSKNTKLMNEAKEVNYYVKIAYYILDDLYKMNKLAFLTDYEVFVKYLKTYITEMKSKFTIYNHLHSDLDVAYAHTMKVRVWLSSFIVKLKNTIARMYVQKEDLTSKLKLDPINIVENYLEATKGKQIS